MNGLQSVDLPFIEDIGKFYKIREGFYTIYITKKYPSRLVIHKHQSSEIELLHSAHYHEPIYEIISIAFKIILQDMKNV